MQPITYPARPFNGGRLGLVLKPRVHLWSAKLNGWRTLVHAPTGTMWNRKGEELSIADEFTVALELLSQSDLVWVDCEALERRHNIGRGTLLILDIVVPELTAAQRHHKAIEQAVLQEWPMLTIGTKPEPNRVYLVQQKALGEASPTGKSALQQDWQLMQSLNAMWKAEFYEGLVAKREDSTYPIQLRNPDAHCPAWVKHRWAF